MRVCLSLIPKKIAPAGGGVKFAIDLITTLQKRGHEIVKDNPDIVFMFDYKKFDSDSFIKWIGIEDLNKFKNAKIIHRINDIGYPKKRPMNFVQKTCELANKSDYVVYVSEYVKNYYKGKVFTSGTVIYNGTNRDVYTFNEDVKMDKVRIVTHHWSDDYLKGWDIYKQLDDWISKHNDMEFMFIGRIPINITLKNTKIVSPKSGKELADFIKKNNIYLTASRYEPSGNHYLEGISCGLPILYHADGGGVLEMENFGLMFNSFDEFTYKIYELWNSYNEYRDNIKNTFNFYSDIVCNKYIDIMEELCLN